MFKACLILASRFASGKCITPMQEKGVFVAVAVAVTVAVFVAVITTGVFVAAGVVGLSFFLQDNNAINTANTKVTITIAFFIFFLLCLESFYFNLYIL
jgi:hypothetical protein